MCKWKGSDITSRKQRSGTDTDLDRSHCRSPEAKSVVMVKAGTPTGKATSIARRKAGDAESTVRQ